MKNAPETYKRFIDQGRDIYELAELFEQNRRPVSSYLDMLQDPKTGEALSLEGNKLSGSNNYPVENEVPYFVEDKQRSEEWRRLNEQFLNYHKSLSVYELINSTPIINYVALKTGLWEAKNMKVLDVGGGTGHTFTSFFHFPETIEYFLLDPNLRLLHDQFIRIYPKLTYLEMGHMIAYAEHLPVKDQSFDLVINLSAIDHLDDYKQFIREAFRVLKPGGQFLVSSHLDTPLDTSQMKKKSKNPLDYNFWERVSRFLYVRKHAVGSDDHTLHIENTAPIVSAMKEAGFEITDEDTFKRYFYVLGKKP